MNAKGPFIRLAEFGLASAVAACASVTEEDRKNVAVVPDSRLTDGSTDVRLATASNAPGRIVLYRTWHGEGLLFLGTGPKVEVDGREIGRCLLGDGATTELAAGDHVISAPHSDVSSRPFRINPDQTVFVECKYTVGALVPNVEFDFHATRN